MFLYVVDKMLNAQTTLDCVRNAVLEMFRSAEEIGFQPNKRLKRKNLIEFEL